MQKKLLSIAIAGALAIPGAAIADVTAKAPKERGSYDSLINIYGQFHASWDYVDNDASGSRDDTDDNTAVFRESHLGFWGEEDLGSGWKGIWQVETYINTNGDNVSLRNTFVGLSSDTWGTIKFGKHDTPYKMATDKLDIFNQTIADYNNIMGAHLSLKFRPGGLDANGNTLYSDIDGDGDPTTNTGTDPNGYRLNYHQTVALDFNERPNQLFMYETPNFNGFQAAIARESFQVDEDTLEDANIAFFERVGLSNRTTAGLPQQPHWTAAGDDEWETWSMMAKYDQGPFYAAIAYEIFEGPNNHSADGDENRRLESRPWVYLWQQHHRPDVRRHRQ
jgi:predicted porin